MWRATVGAIPVKRWTCAASATFSYGSRGTPFWAKTLKRVPELPKAHDGSSIRWARNDATTAWFPTAWLLITSASVAPPGGYLRSCQSGSIVRVHRVRLPTRPAVGGRAPEEVVPDRPPVGSGESGQLQDVPCGASGSDRPDHGG